MTMSVSAAFKICERQFSESRVSTKVKIASIAAGMRMGSACVSPSSSPVIIAVAPVTSFVIFSSERNEVTSVSIICKAPSIRSGAFSMSELQSVESNCTANGMITGRRVAIELVRLVKRLVKAVINESAFWLMEFANCSMSVPTIEINCGATDMTAGSRADKTDCTTVNILGK